MSKPMRGTDLPTELRKHVLAAYIYRWTVENEKAAREHLRRYGFGAPTIAPVTDDEWLRTHVFYVNKRGGLDARRTHAVWVGDNWKPEQER